MSKKLTCGDVMPGCDKVIEGDDEKDLLAKAAEHAKADHNMTSINPDLMAKMRGAMRDA